MFYSATTGGFYALEIHGSRMPADVVEISKEQHAELLAAQAIGKAIAGDGEGRPRLIDAPPPSAVQLDDMRRSEIFAELAAIDAASARPLRSILVGTATDDDRARLAELEARAAELRAELAALDAPPEAPAPPLPVEPTP